MISEAEGLPPSKKETMGRQDDRDLTDTGVKKIRTEVSKDEG